MNPGIISVLSRNKQFYKARDLISWGLSESVFNTEEATNLSLMNGLRRSKLSKLPGFSNKVTAIESYFSVDDCTLGSLPYKAP